MALTPVQVRGEYETKRERARTVENGHHHHIAEIKLQLRIRGYKFVCILFRT